MAETIVERLDLAKDFLGPARVLAVVNGKQREIKGIRSVKLAKEPVSNIWIYFFVGLGLIFLAACGMGGVTAEVAGFVPSAGWAVAIIFFTPPLLIWITRQPKFRIEIESSSGKYVFVTSNTKLALDLIEQISRQILRSP